MMSFARLSTAALLFVSATTLSASDEPYGSLAAASSVVRADSHVSLNWNVEFPEERNLNSLIKVPSDTSNVQIKKSTEAEIRVLGVAYGPSYKQFLVEGYVDGGSGTQSLFTGRGVDVDPSEVVAELDLEAGDELSFHFQGWQNSGPTTPREDWWAAEPVYTGAGDDRLIILKDGDVLPVANPAFDQGDIASFVAPYLREEDDDDDDDDDRDGLVLDLGPKDLIVLVELSNFHREHELADLQDYVLLVTFK